MLHKSYLIKYEDENEESYLTTAESLEEAMEVRVQLVEDGYQKVIIETVRS